MHMPIFCVHFEYQGQSFYVDASDEDTALEIAQSKAETAVEDWDVTEISERVAAESGEEILHQAAD
jgi:hypothetical protein